MVEEALSHVAVPAQAPAGRSTDYFGELVFGRNVMRRYLDRETYEALIQTMEHGTPLTREVADGIAAGMKQWAVERGIRLAVKEMFDRSGVPYPYPRVVTVPHEKPGELVSREGNAFEQVVGRLEEDRRKMEDELEALRASAAQAKANAEASQRLKDEAEAQAKKEIDRARQEAAQIVQKTRQRADALVGELEELRRQKNKQLSAEQKARLRSGLKELESSSDPVHQRRDDNYVLPRPLVVGDEVLLYDIDKEATVLELPKDGTVLVQAGIIKTRVPLENVRLLSKRQLKKKNPTRTVTKNVSTPETSSSLDLRGQTVEEALMEVDNFLDRASRMHLSQVTIIHGKGTGALRTAVQQHLRRCSQVKSFRLGTYGEGESGVTIAELK